MPYSQFTTISKAKQAFNLTTVEGKRFLPDVPPIPPSAVLSSFLEESLPIVATSGSEKARSEGIIYPVLLEVRRILDRSVSLFSGEEFNVQEEVGLNGVCDFLISRSLEVLEIEAPAVVVVEAKKTDLKSGFGQCIAEMVAAQYCGNGCCSTLQSDEGTIDSCDLWLCQQWYPVAAPATGAASGDDRLDGLSSAAC